MKTQSLLLITAVIVEARLADVVNWPWWSVVALLWCTFSAAEIAREMPKAFARQRGDRDDEDDLAFGRAARPVLR